MALRQEMRIKLEGDKPEVIIERIEELMPDNTIKFNRIQNYGDGSTQFEITVLNSEGEIEYQPEYKPMNNVMQYGDSSLWFVELLKVDSWF